MREEKLEDTKGVIRNCIIEGQTIQWPIKRKGTKRTSNDLQNTTKKSNDLSTRTSLKTGGQLKYIVGVPIFFYQLLVSYFTTCMLFKRATTNRKQLLCVRRNGIVLVL